MNLRTAASGRGASLALNGMLLAVIAGAAAALVTLLWRAAETDAARAESAAVVHALLMAQMAPQLAPGPGVDEALATQVQRESARVLLLGVFDAQGSWTALGAARGLGPDDIREQVDLAGEAPVVRPLRLRGAAAHGVRLATLPLETVPPGTPRRVLAAVVDVRDVPGATPDIAGALLAAAAGLVASAGWLAVTIVAPVRRVAQAAAGSIEPARPPVVPRELENLWLSIASLLDELKHWKLEAHTLKQTLEDRVTRRTHTVERALRQAERAAESDPLSGLRNRRAFERDFGALFTRAAERRSELCLAMIDVDHFKRLNDTLGHAAGDALISFVGELLNSGTRRGLDVTARLGGDEFVAALPGVALAEAVAVMERLCAMFTQHARTLGEVSERPAMSIGIASLRDDHAGDADAMLAQADAAMYAAKRYGRSIMTVAAGKAAGPLAPGAGAPGSRR